jgi:hypothetical protein
MSTSFCSNRPISWEVSLIHASFAWKLFSVIRATFLYSPPSDISWPLANTIFWKRKTVDPFLALKPLIVI